MVKELQATRIHFYNLFDILDINLINSICQLQIHWHQSLPNTRYPLTAQCPITTQHIVTEVTYPGELSIISFSDRGEESVLLPSPSYWSSVPSLPSHGSGDVLRVRPRPRLRSLLLHPLRLLRLPDDPVLWSRWRRKGHPRLLWHHHVHISHTIPMVHHPFYLSWRYIRSFSNHCIWKLQLVGNSLIRNFISSG